MQLQTLGDLQQQDSRIAALEGEVARLPKRIAAIEAALVEAKKSLDTLRGRQDKARKDLRAQEKDLEVVALKRSKSESRLYEVKTNKEYSAVLLEIEEIKQEKAEIEEKILGLMELQEGIAADIRGAEQVHAQREDQAKHDIVEVRTRLAAVEAELTAARATRAARASELPVALLSDYDRIRKARGGVAVATVGATAICSACRVTIRPQAIQELRAANSLMLCENCGRFLFWQE
ncbi:MAG: zinc ribbon domain-containing protein [Candidatus Rokuibacteriota bacterium]